jgi:hypothetical protein
MVWLLRDKASKTKEEGDNREEEEGEDRRSTPAGWPLALPFGSIFTTSWSTTTISTCIPAGGA